MNYVTPIAIYFSPAQALFSLDNSYCQLISTKSVVSLVFTSAVLLLFKSFTTGPGYVTNCNFVSISCSLSLLLLLLYFYSDICINDLFSVDIHIFTFYIQIFVYLGNRLNVYSCCGVKHTVFIYRASMTCAFIQKKTKN